MKKKIKKPVSHSPGPETASGKRKAEKPTRRQERKLAKKVEAHTLHERGVLPGEEDPESGHPF